MPDPVPLPVRASQSGPHTPTHPSNLSLYQETPYSQTTIALTPDNLGVNEHVIPLPMNPRIRDVYTGIMRQSRNAIENILSDEMPDEDLLREVKLLILRLDSVTTHVDLEGGDSPESQEHLSKASHIDEAVWAENNSSKFQLLHNLFENIHYMQSWSIAIIARPGLLLDILEVYMSGRNVRYFRPDKGTQSNPNDPHLAKSQFEVWLYPSGNAGASLPSKPANLVIAFDGSFDPNDSLVQRLRALPNPSLSAPVIHLLVYKSAEHISRCVSKVRDESSRLRRIISGVYQTRHEVGHLSPEVTDVQGCAEEINAFLVPGGLPIHWTLPKIPSIDIALMESSDDVESSNDQANSQLSEESLAPTHGSALKRVWIVSCRFLASKHFFAFQNQKI